MGRIGFLAVFFIVFVVADVSDASSSLSMHRILIGEPQNDNTTVPVTLFPSTDSEFLVFLVQTWKIYLFSETLGQGQGGFSGA